jgi:hypothetical protein
VPVWLKKESHLTKKVETFPVGTQVTWHYRSAIGHGTIEGIAKKGKTSANTKYRIREHDHHPGEPEIVEHYGHALHLVRSTKKAKKSMTCFVQDGRLLIKVSR